jgi:hypothetical protein
VKANSISGLETGATFIRVDFAAVVSLPIINQLPNESSFALLLNGTITLKI